MSTKPGVEPEPRRFDVDRYPGRGLSVDERRRLESFDLSIDDLTPDHIIFSLGRYVETSFANFYTVAAELVGEEAARKIAFEVGRRHGGRGYAKVLEAEGTPGAGSPRAMARYQDLAHALRGPKHSRALFAQYDSERCTVAKPECGYFDAGRPETARYVGAFEAGCFEGYKEADRLLTQVNVTTCCWRGDGACHIEFLWRRP